ncbi:unnamed protein product [Closterium sp. Naga37s-1]|nr:unnamed protein product [Closterium sp. Naga37s-1]
MASKPSRRAQLRGAASASPSEGTAGAALPPSLFAKGPFPFRAALLASAAPDSLPPGPGGAAQAAGVETTDGGRTDTVRCAEGAEGRGESDGSEGLSGQRRGLTCWSCGEAFDAVAEQRAHFKSDWHRLNVKRRASGRAVLSEEAFAELLDARRAGEGGGEGGRHRGRQGSTDAVGAAVSGGAGGAVEEQQGEGGGEEDDDWSSISGSEDEEGGDDADEGQQQQGEGRVAGAGRGAKVRSSLQVRSSPQVPTSPLCPPPTSTVPCCAQLPPCSPSFPVFPCPATRLCRPAPSEEGADLLQALVALGEGAGGTDGVAFRGGGEGSAEAGEKDGGRSTGGALVNSARGKAGGGATQVEAGRGGTPVVKSGVQERDGGGQGGERVWVVVLSSGGHFAAVVVDAASWGAVLAHRSFHRCVQGGGRRRNGGEGGGRGRVCGTHAWVVGLDVTVGAWGNDVWGHCEGKEEPCDMEWYVVRAKAGGRQATRDGAGRAPQSAGASLRRYNEAALVKDIRALLQRWQPYLAQAQFIFVHATTPNRAALFGTAAEAQASRGTAGAGAVLLQARDPRVRRVPFPVRRPTVKEALRVAHSLAHVHVLGWAQGAEGGEGRAAGVGCEEGGELAVAGKGVVAVSGGEKGTERSEGEGGVQMGEREVEERLRGTGREGDGDVELKGDREGEERGEASGASGGEVEEKEAAGKGWS